MDDQLHTQILYYSNWVSGKSCPPVPAQRPLAPALSPLGDSDRWIQDVGRGALIRRLIGRHVGAELVPVGVSDCGDEFVEGGGESEERVSGLVAEFLVPAS